MALKSILTAGAAVVLAGALLDIPARAAAEPTIVVVDDPHDVVMNPGTPLTRAERRSIEIKWFKATPRTNDRVRFTVKIARVFRTARFAQEIDIEMYNVPASSAEGWSYGLYTIHTGPNPYASASLDFGHICKRLHLRLNRAAKTVSISIPARCLGTGTAKVSVNTYTLWTDPETGNLLGPSRDGLRFRGAVR